MISKAKQKKFWIPALFVIWGLLYVSGFAGGIVMIGTFCIAAVIFLLVYVK